MSDRRLQTVLSRIRRRLLVVGGTASICWALLSAIVVALVGVWLDLLWELSPPWRVAVSLVAGIAGVLFLGRMWIHTTKTAQHALAARHADRVAGGGGMIVSGWELASAPPAPATRWSVTLTTGLARMAVEQAASLADKVSTTQAVTSRPARHAAATLGLIVVLVATVAWCFPSMMRTEWQRFLDPYADVPPYSTLQFDVTPGDTAVVFGQGLDVQVAVTGGLAEQVELVFEQESGAWEILPMFPEPGHRWRTSLSRITAPATYFVRAERGRSTRHHISVITVPRIEAVRFRVTPPAYTHDAPYEGPLPKQGLAGLTGTHVTAWAQSNRPLSGGSIEFDPAGAHSPVPLQPLQPGAQEVNGTFDIVSAGRFQLSVVDVDGQASQDRYSGSVTLLADQRPMIRLTEPPIVSLATPHTSLPIGVAAEDDYGIARVQIFRSLNNSRPLPVDISVPSPAPRRWQHQTLLPLSEYGLVPGDEIKFFARVEDNDPAGAKGTESEVATVRIISQEEFERMVQIQHGLELLLSKYESAQQRMEQLQEQLRVLQEELAAADPDAAASEALRDKLRQLAEQLQQQASAIRESADQALPYDADRNLTPQLQRVSSEMNAAAATLENAASAGDATNRQLAEQLQQLAQRLDQQRQQFQQETVEPLTNLALVYPLLEDQSRFVDLALRQRDLSERLASVKDSNSQDDPAVQKRMRELEDEQRALREELEDLLNAIDAHVSQLPDAEMYDRLRLSASAFVAAAAVSGASEAMANAEMALAEFAGTRAFEEAKRAADALEGLLSKCQSMGGAGEGCLTFQPGLSTSLGNTVQQLLAQAGLGSGASSGMGTGTGGGYSARRGAQGQVGLYGGLPGYNGQGDGRGRRGDTRARGGASSATASDGAADPQFFQSRESADAVGNSQGLIPAIYRQRVGQYFLRITEEAKNK